MSNQNFSLRPAPSQSILPDAALPIRQFPDPVFDKRTLARDAIVGGITGVLLFFAFIALFFVELH